MPEDYKELLKETAFFTQEYFYLLEAHREEKGTESKIIFNQKNLEKDLVKVKKVLDKIEEIGILIT